MDTRRVISNGTKNMAEKTHPYSNTVWYPISLDSAFEISQLQKNCLSLTQPFVLSDLLTFFYPHCFLWVNNGVWLFVLSQSLRANRIWQESRSRWLVSHLLS